MTTTELRPGVLYQCESGRKLVTRTITDVDGDDVVYVESDCDMRQKHSAEWFAQHVIGVVQMPGKW